ncbi:MAG: DUF262 domain-containing protein [Bacteroides sp.]|nr:DUF262 domain-containing protein [Bacteroides sp.]MCM1447183.1 DUF262 domain-containing protein [Bacteroides sp.]MCM1515079.1 DUF262 domain-containing protein [Paraprevotella sp.]
MTEEQSTHEIVYEKENEEFDIESYPFDPKHISIDKKPLTMDAIIRRLKQGTIILHPDFQREEVWSPENKSRLIESLLLNIPITMFYVSADTDGNYTVVDGLQRLSAIRDFVLKEKFKTSDTRNLGNGMRLVGLEFLTKYEGMTFNELPVSMQNRINETEFTFTIINPGTPEEVKRNIFKRINTGGKVLKAQEIRNALYAGESTALLKKLTESPAFKKATTKSISHDRMDDYEVVLRGLSFLIRDAEVYPKNGNMDKFLSDTMVILNSYPSFNNREIKRLVVTEGLDIQYIHNDRIKAIEEIFQTAMTRAIKLFGKHAFRKSYGAKKKSPINKALFEIWCSTLGSLDQGVFEKLLQRQSDFKKEYNELLDDHKFSIYISRDSWKPNSVKQRYDKINELILKYTS